MTVSIVTLLEFASSGHALTMKPGQVIGSDGNLYDETYPEMIANLIKNAKQTGKMAGISGKSVYVVVDLPGEEGEKDVVFINLDEFAGKDKDGIQAIVIDRVVGHLNAGTNIGFNASQIGAKLDREMATAA